MTGDDRFAKIPVGLHELLERGEISREAFALYTATADAALSSTLDSSGHAHNTAPARFVEVGGIRFAYRRFGNPVGTPIVLLQHFMGNLDNYDPAITEALAMGRDAPLFRKVYTPQDLMWLPIFFSAADAFNGRSRVGA